MVTLDSIRNVELPAPGFDWIGASRVPAAVDQALRRAPTCRQDRGRRAADAGKYEELARRRRRAQIAARHALGLS